MPRGHNANRPVHGRPEIVVVAALRLPRVDPYTHPDRAGSPPFRHGEPFLDVQRGGDSMVRRVEDRDKTVASGLHDAPARLTNAARQDVVVTCESDGHGLALFIPEARTALDVG